MGFRAVDGLTGLHTYASMGLSDITEIWDTLGTGKGAVRLERRREDSGIADVKDGELRMLMGTAGVRSTFGQAEQADAHGALMADAGYVRLETGEGLYTVNFYGMVASKALGISFQCFSGALPFLKTNYAI